ncbi:MAG: aryl-sulfate sulfotransferase [Myxococcota bacterium]
MTIGVWWLSACTDEPPGGTETGSPLALDVAVTEVAAPLARRLHLEADAPVTVRASWTDGEDTVDVAFDDPAAVHDHLLLGFRAGRSYTVTVTATAGDRTASDTLPVDTAPLPVHFPRATVSGDGPVEPGHTLLPMRSFQAPDPQDLAVVFDEEGRIVYWLAVGDVIQDVREVDGGLLALVGDVGARVVRYDWDGTEVGEWSAATLGTAIADDLHHDVIEVEPDHYVALGRTPISVPDYPASYDDAAATVARTVADDVVVEFLADGTVIDETRLTALLPLRRIGYDSLSTTIEGWADWAHANAVLRDTDGSLVVSLRHQDAIVKIDPAAGTGAGAVRWVFGYPENWPAELAAKRLQPVGPVRWPYHQHGPHLTADRRLLVFDNGNWQAAPYTGDPPIVDPVLLRSRVAQFTIDEDAGTVREDWSFDAPDGGTLFSEAVGDADPLPNGHVLSSWGFLDRLPDGTSNADAGVGERSVRVIELDPDAAGGPAQVHELYLWTAAADNPHGWTGYRAERIPSLYDQRP